MKGRRWVVPLVAMWFLSTACGPASPSDPNGYSTTDVPTATPSPAPSQVIERTDWRLAEPAEGTELSVVVPIPSPDACGFFERADVMETAERVTIETFVRRRIPGPDEACPEHLAFEPVTVTLEQPVGDRQLDGCDAPPDGNAYFTEPVPPEGCGSATDL